MKTKAEVKTVGGLDRLDKGRFCELYRRALKGILTTKEQMALACEAARIRFVEHEALAAVRACQSALEQVEPREPHLLQTYWQCRHVESLLQHGPMIEGVRVFQSTEVLLSLRMEYQDLLDREKGAHTAGREQEVAALRIARASLEHLATRLGLELEAPPGDAQR